MGPPRKKFVPDGCRTAFGVDLIQGGQKAGQVGREVTQIRDALDGRMLAVQPSVDRPRPRGLSTKRHCFSGSPEQHAIFCCGVSFGCPDTVCAMATLKRIAPIFPVRDLSTSLAHYQRL